MKTHESKSPICCESVDMLASEDGEVFISFASPERRFLGIPQRFGKYKPSRIYLLHIVDEPNEHRAQNIKDFNDLTSAAAPCHMIATKHCDALIGIKELISEINLRQKSTPVAIDVSTFPKAVLLLVLRALNRLDVVSRVRILYTEPAQYAEWLKEPTSYGVRKLAVVPTFAASYRAHQDLVMVAMLGFERDRAFGMWQGIEPNRTIAIIGRPAYLPQWEGMAESINAAFLAGLDRANIFYADPRDPVATCNLLAEIIQPTKPPTANFYIAPLGTKPQTVGLHYFCEKYPEAGTVAYASPMQYSSEYISSGVGRSWVLNRPEDQK